MAKSKESAKRLQLLREELDLSQEEFGMSFRLGQKTISRYESGEDIPFVFAIAVEHIFGYSAKWLLTGAGEKTMRDVTMTITSFDEDVIRFVKEHRYFYDSIQKFAEYQSSYNQSNNKTSDVLQFNSK